MKAYFCCYDDNFEDEQNGLDVSVWKDKKSAEGEAERMLQEDGDITTSITLYTVEVVEVDTYEFKVTKVGD